MSGAALTALVVNLAEHLAGSAFDYTQVITFALEAGMHCRTSKTFGVGDFRIIVKIHSESIH